MQVNTAGADVGGFTRKGSAVHAIVTIKKKKLGNQNYRQGLVIICDNVIEVGFVFA